ncbi:MAG: 3-isopropylmalate dehydrogenase [Gammaproteobacteria bacterium]|nr:3-isopropylmalate dehydrogenase [Gammaproteobacteria bacterium]
MKARIAVLPGDGIGPEVTAEAVRALRAVAARFGHDFGFEEAPVGAAAMDAGQEPLPAATLALARECDAILFGAIGALKYADPAARIRPEQAILGLREALGLYANLRPVVPQPALHVASPLKESLLGGVDLLIVRELTGGIYFGRRTREADSATDECRYTAGEIERIARIAFRLAAARRGRVTSVDKANVLETSRLWRETVTRVVREEFPAITLEHQLVDSAAMLLLTRPASFDVLVTENLFGDILSDEAAALAGSLGLMPSASLGDGRRGLYEPIHGSAPDIAGRGIANPYGAIASAALLLRHSLGLETEAAAVERAVAEAIAAGVLTPDIAPRGTDAAPTQAAGDAVVDRLRVS